jgi:hypothetical protein
MAVQPKKKKKKEKKIKAPIIEKSKTEAAAVKTAVLEPPQRTWAEVLAESQRRLAALEIKRPPVEPITVSKTGLSVSAEEPVQAPAIGEQTAAPVTVQPVTPEPPRDAAKADQVAASAAVQAATLEPTQVANTSMTIRFSDEERLALIREEAAFVESAMSSRRDGYGYIDDRQMCLKFGDALMQCKHLARWLVTSQASVVARTINGWARKASLGRPRMLQMADIATEKMGVLTDAATWAQTMKDAEAIWKAAESLDAATDRGRGQGGKGTPPSGDSRY